MTLPPAGPLSPAVLRELMDLDDGAKGLVAEMAELFRKDSPGRLQTLREALLEGDLLLASQMAHAFKGAAGTIGALGLKDQLAVIEHACRHHQPEGLLEQLPAIEAAYEEVLAALDAFLRA